MGDGLAKQQTKAGAILVGLDNAKERRKKLINVIGECVTRFVPISEKDSAVKDKAPRESGFLSDLQEFVEDLQYDNDRLEVIADTLQKII